MIASFDAKEDKNSAHEARLEIVMKLMAGTQGERLPYPHLLVSEAEVEGRSTMPESRCLIGWFLDRWCAMMRITGRPEVRCVAFPIHHDIMGRESKYVQM